MHADATCEDGRGTMLVILAGWRRWVLGAWKIPTENAEAILACARLTIERFGEPCAVMRDLGRAMISACDDLVAGLGAVVKVLACHQHFLADVGSDLLQSGHDALRRLKVRGALRARRVVDGRLRTPTKDARLLRALRRLGRILDPVRQEPGLARVVRDLRVRANLFDELRAALRLFPGSYGRSRPSSKRPLTLLQARTELRDIRAALRRFTASLRKRRPQRGPAQDLREAIDVIFEHLKRHGKSLWGHEVRLPAQAGGGVRLVERTNNLPEHFFHAMKHGERRRSGRKNLARDFELLPPESALVQNFNHPDYVQIVCGSLERLPRVFAEMDAADRAKRSRRPQAAKGADPVPQPVIETGSLPAIDRRLIRSEAMRRSIDTVIRSRPPRVTLSGAYRPSATVS